MGHGTHLNANQGKCKIKISFIQYIHMLELIYVDSSAVNWLKKIN